MPVFNAYVPAERFSTDQKQTLATALPQALHDALGIPADDQFVVISEQPAGTLVLSPTYMGMNRSSDATMITVLFTAERPLDDKRALVRAICDHAVEALGISPDDVFIALIPVPKENFSFGRGDFNSRRGPEVEECIYAGQFRRHVRYRSTMTANTRLRRRRSASTHRVEPGECVLGGGDVPTWDRRQPRCDQARVHEVGFE
jgi:phenylpyruvate tautomerase PptA (4-oxalocrotonate tautomerase family)